MRDDQIRARLVESNPWWRAAAAGSDPAAWTADDPMLRSRSGYDLGYRPTVLDDVSLGEVDDKLIVLRGPRRVGKSVVLKDTIAALCNRPDVNPLQVIYLPADGMRSGDLNRVAALGRDLTRSVGDAPRLWLLDEITAVAGWTETMKYLRDNTALGSDTVICTGSSWDQNARIEQDLLAGRAGRASTRRPRFLLPMRFRDVVLATGREVPLPDVLAPWNLQGEGAANAARAAELYIGELDLAWQSYLSSGGFPRAVAEYHRDGLVSDSFVADLVAWLHRDVDPDRSDDSVALLLAELTRRSTSPLNRANAARELGYANRQSFDLRLARLVSSFAALWCHQVDNIGHRVTGAQSKLYLTDPLLAWLAGRTRAGLPSPDFSQLTESALAVALARTIDDSQAGRWNASDTVGYHRTGGGREVDFAAVPLPTAAGTEHTTPLESKWVSQGWRGEARTLESSFGLGVLATRNIVDLQHPVWAIPAPVVALLLG